MTGSGLQEDDRALQTAAGVPCQPPDGCRRRATSPLKLAAGSPSRGTRGGRKSAPKRAEGATRSRDPCAQAAARSPAPRHGLGPLGAPGGGRSAASPGAAPRGPEDATPAGTHPGAPLTFKEALQSLRLVHHLHSCAMHRAAGLLSAAGHPPGPLRSAPQGSRSRRPGLGLGAAAPRSASPLLRPRSRPRSRSASAARSPPGGPDGQRSRGGGGPGAVGGRPASGVGARGVNEVTVVRAQLTKSRAPARRRLWDHSLRGR